MDDEDVHEDLIGALYEAAMAPSLWMPTLGRVSEWIGASAFHMFAWDEHAQGSRLFLVSHPEFIEAIQKFDNYYGKIDVVRERALSVAPGQFFVTQEHFDDRFVKRSEWFQDFLIPHGMCWTTGGTVPVEEGVHTVLAMLRSHDRGRYSVTELQRARRLWPHFNRATSLFIQTEALRHQATLGADALQKMELGIVATDHKGRVFFANRQAESLLSNHPDLRLRGHLLQGKSATMDGTLHNALLSAGATGKGTSFTVQGNTHPDLLITAAPLRQSSTFSALLGQPSVLVMIRARNHQRMLSGQQLMQLFSLSPAEARLARAIAHGKTPEEYAVEAAVSITTVRTQLRRVLEKTGTSRQSELVRLIGAIPPLR